MGIADWLRVGLKLLGVYLFVDGIGHAVWAALTILEIVPKVDDWGVSFLSRIQWYQTSAYAVVRLGAALVLLFGTDRCIRLISGPSVEKLGDTRIRPSTARDATNFSMDSEAP